MVITGRHIAAARALLNITQADVAEASGIHVRTIRAFELGDHMPRPATVDAIREALERRGIEFSNGDEPGVKLRRSRAVIPAP